MSQIERNKNESFDAFMRRVKREWRNQGTILEVRKKQYFDPKKSKNVTRTSTVRKVQTQSKLAYLKKTGKISEDQFQV
jgi:ribosomal protein S21